MFRNNSISILFRAFGLKSSCVTGGFIFKFGWVAFLASCAFCAMLFENKLASTSAINPVKYEEYRSNRPSIITNSMKNKETTQMVRTNQEKQKNGLSYSISKRSFKRSKSFPEKIRNYLAQHKAPNENGKSQNSDEFFTVVSSLLRVMAGSNDYELFLSSLYNLIFERLNCPKTQSLSLSDMRNELLMSFRVLSFFTKLDHIKMYNLLEAKKLKMRPIKVIFGRIRKIISAECKFKKDTPSFWILDNCKLCSANKKLIGKNNVSPWVIIDVEVLKIIRTWGLDSESLFWDVTMKLIFGMGYKNMGVVFPNNDKPNKTYLFGLNLQKRKFTITKALKTADKILYYTLSEDGKHNTVYQLEKDAIFHFLTITRETSTNYA